VEKRVYETVVVYDGVLSEDTLRKELEAIKTFVQGEDTLHRVDEWGRRELAYPIRKRKSGFYVLLVHGAKDETVRKLNRMLRLNENVLRFLVTVAEDAEAALNPKPKVVPRPVDGPGAPGDAAAEG
jgi:small subunit ribosomal protein S6